MRAAEQATRAALLASLASTGARYRPRAEMAVELTFFTARKEPPRFDHLVKRFLDLLKAPDRSRPDGSGLFWDDRQVSLLSVRAFDSHGYGQARPKTSVEATSMGDLLTQLRIARSLHLDGSLDDLDDDEDQSVIIDDDDLESEAEWLASSDLREQQIGETFKNIRLMGQQTEIVHGLERWLRHLWSGQADLLYRGRPRHDPLAAPGGASPAEPSRFHVGLPRTRQDLLDYVFPGQIVPLASSPGSGASFDEARDKQIASIAERFLPDLRIPVRVCVLFIPAADAAPDVDNVMHRVLQSVFHHLAPPAAAQRQDPNQPRLGTGHVVGYEIARLDRTDHDPPDGRMYLTFGDGYRPSSWQQVLARIDQALE